jgi:glycosyltransferase involved in cell wall biosynthesis
MQINPCIIIPIFNNKDTVRDVVESLAYLELPVLIVDDGSDAATAETLDAIDAEFGWVTLIHRATNGGKGAAMDIGFQAAFGRGYTHAVQMDADGQHAATDVPRFLDAAKRTPGALILSRPQFDASAPRSRRYGRRITSFFARIETLSSDIADPLSGFRCYPLAPVIELYRHVRIGYGMVFDTEIAVHLHWRGVAMVNLDTRVIYPRGGLSHFRYLADNLHISWMHTKLLVGMLLRLPRLLRDSPFSWRK